MKKPPAINPEVIMKRDPISWDNQREYLDHVKASGMQNSKSARQVFEGLMAGTISVADATELSNALGKANGADGNIIKAVLVGVMLDKLELNYSEKQLPAIEP